MRFYNTLSGIKEEFHPSDAAVKLYVCGITPYAPSHIGHAMFSIVFDVIRRYLEFKGYKVKHVQNFTDIDDKMIKSASEQGITTRELSEKYIEAYLEEIQTLNVLPAHMYPKATQEIAKIIDIIESLGSYVEDDDGDDPRVEGSLAVSRSFGDNEFGINVVSKEPDVKCIKLNTIKKGDIVIVASDGLWDGISNKDAIQTALIMKKKEKSNFDICRMLVKMAKPNTDDNITVLVLSF